MSPAGPDLSPPGGGGEGGDEACVRVTEGGATFEVAQGRQEGYGKEPGFWNPKMRTVRDITVCSLAVILAERPRDLPPATCVEPFTSAGAMALRWAMEAGGAAQRMLNDGGVEMPAAMITANDFDPACCDMARRNFRAAAEGGGQGAGMAGSARVVCSDANVLLHQSSYDFIHLDPFGSCVPFLDAAFSHAPHGGVVSLDATDVSSLFGIYPKVTKRMYGAHLPGSLAGLQREIGARLLLAAAAAAAARQGRGVVPLVTASQGHFVLVQVRVYKGAGKTDASVGQVALLWLCACGEPSRLPGGCGCGGGGCGDGGGDGGGEWIGPMWTGELFDAKFCQSLEAAGRSVSPPLALPTRALLSTLKEESAVRGSLFINRLHRHGAARGGAIPAVAETIEALQSRGHGASRTHFDPRAIRTAAGHEELARAMDEVVEGGRGGRGAGGARGGAGGRGGARAAQAVSGGRGGARGAPGGAPGRVGAERGGLFWLAMVCSLWWAAG